VKIVVLELFIRDERWKSKQGFFVVESDSGPLSRLQGLMLDLVGLKWWDL